MAWPHRRRGMRTSWLWPSGWLLALALGTPLRGDAVELANVSVDVRTSLVRISTDAARAEVKRRRFRLKVRDLSERRLVLRERRKGGLFYERNGARYGLGEKGGPWIC